MFKVFWNSGNANSFLQNVDVGNTTDRSLSRPALVMTLFHASPLFRVPLLKMPLYYLANPPLLLPKLGCLSLGLIVKSSCSHCCRPVNITHNWVFSLHKICSSCESSLLAESYGTLSRTSSFLSRPLMLKTHWKRVPVLVREFSVTNWPDSGRLHSHMVETNYTHQQTF